MLTERKEMCTATKINTLLCLFGLLDMKQVFYLHIVTNNLHFLINNLLEKQQTALCPSFF